MTTGEIYLLIIWGIALVGIFTGALALDDGAAEVASFFALVALMLVLIVGFIGLLDLDQPVYNVTCGEVQYKNAKVQFDGNYLRIEADGVTHYEDGPCAWSLP